MNPKKLRILFFGWLVLTALAVFFFYRATRPSEPVAPALPIIAGVPNFSLTDQDNRTVTGKDMAGKVVIADFIFTSCGGPCPIMTATMAGLQQKIPADKNIHFLSVSVDPETDTPEVLREYAAQYKADTKRWTFLTGGKTEINSLSKQGFRLALDDTDSTNIIHSTKFVLVDKLGMIRGYYHSDEPASMDQLVKDAQELERE